MSKRRFFQEPPRVTLGEKAESWRESVVLGAAAGVFWAPFVLAIMLAKPLKKIFGGLLDLVLVLLSFLISRVAILLFALLGRAKHTGWGLQDNPRRS